MDHAGRITHRDDFQVGEDAKLRFIAAMPRTLPGGGCGGHHPTPAPVPTPPPAPGPGPVPQPYPTPTPPAPPTPPNPKHGHMYPPTPGNQSFQQQLQRIIELLQALMMNYGPQPMPFQLDASVPPAIAGAANVAKADSGAKTAAATA